MFLLLLGLVLLYIIVSKLSVYLQSRNFAAPTHVRKDWTFGFELIKPMLKASSLGRTLEFNEERIYDDKSDLKAHTWKMYVAGSEVITTKNPDNIKHVLATQFKDFELGVRHPALMPLLGNGIFTLDGDGWKHSRTMLRPQFAREQVSHVDMLTPHVNTLIDIIKSEKNATFDLQKLFFKLTVDTATEFLYGESVNSLNPIHDPSFPEREIFSDAFDEAQHYLAKRILLQKLYWVLNNKEYGKNLKIVKRFLDHYINIALSLSPEELDKKRYIFLYELAKQTRDPIVLRDQALNVLLAGRDTTAGLLSFTFHELGRKPEILKKLKEEILGAFGTETNNITFESLKKLSYLKAVINETLRVFPTVPKNFRVANKNTFLVKGGGPDGEDPIFVKKGQSVMYSVYAMHRDPLIYGEDAHVYRPERWFEEHTRQLGWAYLPFNGGPRICLGQQYALTEASYVIVRLLQSFDNFKTHVDEEPPRKDNNLTLSFHGKLSYTMS